MRLFITGGTGFVGSNFINLAHENGHELIVLKRNEFSKPRIMLEKEPTWIYGDMTQVSQDVFKNIDVFVHLASHSVFPPYDSLENCMIENVIKPISLIKKAIAENVYKFVIAGSCFEYGKSGEKYDFIPSNAPLEPTLSYAASKAAASICFSQMAIEFRLKLQIYRLFQVYGLGEHESRFWPSLKKAALSGEDFLLTEGEQIRDFVNVKFVVESLLSACENSESISFGLPLIKNLGSGNPQSIKEFAIINWKKWGAKGKLIFGAKPYRKDEIMRYVPEI